LITTRVNSGAFTFILYINDLPPRINTSSESVVIFADGTSVILVSRNDGGFSSVLNIVLSHMSKWFTAKNLALNLDKMQ
jgi:hypothetical protein